MTLRPAREDEARTIKRLVRNEGLNPLGLDWQRFTIAESGEGELAGIVQLKPHRDGSLELASLVVVPEWRGQGVAAYLIEAMQARAGRPLWLMCGSQLAGFYSQFGFREVEAFSQMPPYFRRIGRLFQVLRWLSGYEQRLAIMVWD